MGRHPYSMSRAVRARAPYRALAAGVLFRARFDADRGRTITDDEREVLGWWAERIGLPASIVEPLLSPYTKSPTPNV